MEKVLLFSVDNWNVFLEDWFSYLLGLFAGAYLLYGLLNLFLFPFLENFIKKICEK